jgi:hypothetical protein
LNVVQSSNHNHPIRSGFVHTYREFAVDKFFKKINDIAMLDIIIHPILHSRRHEHLHDEPNEDSSTPRLNGLTYPHWNHRSPSPFHFVLEKLRAPRLILRFARYFISPFKSPTDHRQIATPRCLRRFFISASTDLLEISVSRIPIWRH